MLSSSLIKCYNLVKRLLLHTRLWSQVSFAPLTSQLFRIAFQRAGDCQNSVSWFSKPHMMQLPSYVTIITHTLTTTHYIHMCRA